MFEDMRINTLKQQEVLYGKIIKQRVGLWSINQRRIKRRTKEKHENKYIKVSKEDYEKAIEILKREGIEID